MAGLFKFLAYATYFICGIVGLIMGLQLLAHMWGTFWAVVCFFLFPIPIYISPWIAIFRDGDWTLFFVSYGGTVAAVILSWIGNAFSRE